MSNQWNIFCIVLCSFLAHISNRFMWGALFLCSLDSQLDFEFTNVNLKEEAFHVERPVIHN